MLSATHVAVPNPEWICGIPEKPWKGGGGAFLVLWFAVEFIVDCIIPKKIWGVYSGGYSIFHFIGIYLLGTFLHAHVERGRTLLSQRRWFLMYVGLSLFSYILYKGLDCVCFDSGFARSLTAASQQRLESYSSPLVIAASATLVMFFSGIKIHSSTINHLAQSMFAVFLAHCPHLYCRTISGIAMNHGGIESIAMIAGFILIVFCGAVLMDQMRLGLWRTMCMLVERVRGRCS